MRMERRGKVESGRKNKGPTITEGERRGSKRKEREEKGICRTNVKLLPTRLP